MKRALDIVAAALGLVLLAPLLIVIALWVRLDSPGPALFRQTRVGRHGAAFQIHKFRTMHAGAPSHGLAVTADGDARITRSGRWLRASKCDELPQLWDVLRGAMSLVGPRPEVPQYVAHYPADLRDMVLSVRPGITDLASLRYRHESALLAASSDPERTYIDEVLPAKLQLAAEYVRTQSGWGDVKIIWATLRAL